MTTLVSLLNYKVKLLALLATDTMTGKLNQNLREPQIVEITQHEKNDNDAPNFFREAPGQEEAPMPTRGAVPGDPVCTEAFGDVSGSKERDGQDLHDRFDVEGPEGTEVDLR